MTNWCGLQQEVLITKACLCVGMVWPQAEIVYMWNKVGILARVVYICTHTLLDF